MESSAECWVQEELEPPKTQKNNIALLLESSGHQSVHNKPNVDGRGRKCSKKENGTEWRHQNVVERKVNQTF